VRAAIDVLGRGSYSQLPLALESAEPPVPPSADEKRDALAWLRDVLRYRSAHWVLPEGVELREGRGCVVCRLSGEYEVALSSLTLIQPTLTPCLP
jgi:hypothetical protein